jgi:hypothetical protein
MLLIMIKSWKWLWYGGNDEGNGFLISHLRLLT